jgi:hypothetical protein
VLSAPNQCLPHIQSLIGCVHLAAIHHQIRGWCTLPAIISHNANADTREITHLQLTLSPGIVRGFF